MARRFSPCFFAWFLYLYWTQHTRDIFLNGCWAHFLWSAALVQTVMLSDLCNRDGWLQYKAWTKGADEDCYRNFRSLHKRYMDGVTPVFWWKGRSPRKLWAGSATLLSLFLLGGPLSGFAKPVSGV